MDCGAVVKGHALSIIDKEVEYQAVLGTAEVTANEGAAMVGAHAMNDL